MCVTCKSVLNSVSLETRNDKCKVGTEKSESALSVLSQGLSEELFKWGRGGRIGLRWLRPFVRDSVRGEESAERSERAGGGSRGSPAGSRTLQESQRFACSLGG